MYQDFKPIVLRKRPVKFNKNPVKKKTEKVEKNNPDLEEIPRLNLISHDVSQKLKDARNIKKWSQRDLALKINENISVVSDYESGRAIVNPKILRKLFKVLDIS